MISICIPVYNYDIRQLIESLSSQLSTLNLPSEIVVIDDCSNNQYRTINASTASKVNYIQLSKNIGRASIRNLLFQNAQYDLLIFLDCDVSIPSPDFVKNYLVFFSNNQHIDVICGGIAMPSKPADKSKYYRWLYGIKRECIPAAIRQKQPYKSFMTGNFAIRRKVLENIKFDERLNTYGHEDTLFGYALMKQQIFIAHIDNPVIHLQIEDTPTFLNKTNQAIQNLVYVIHEIIPDDKQFIKQVRLLNTFFQLKKLHLTPVVHLLSLLTQRPIEILLKKNLMPLYIFDLYKLGRLIIEYNKAKKSLLTEPKNE